MTFTSACACPLTDQDLQDDVHLSLCMPIIWPQSVHAHCLIKICKMTFTSACACMPIVWSKLTRWRSHQPVHAHCLIKTYKMTFTSACVCPLSDQNLQADVHISLCMPIVWSKFTRWHSHQPVHAHCLIKTYKMTFTSACVCPLSDQNLQDDIHISLYMPIVWSKLKDDIHFNLCMPIVWPQPVHAHCLIKTYKMTFTSACACPLSDLSQCMPIVWSKLIRWRSHQPVHAHCLIKTYNMMFTSAFACPLSDQNLQDDVHINLCMPIVWSKLIRWRSH